MAGKLQDMSNILGFFNYLLRQIDLEYRKDNLSLPEKNPLVMETTEIMR